MNSHRVRTGLRNERGAAIVEFAIVLPLLLLLVFGIIEFGRAYSVKVQVTGSVREGARALALGKPEQDVRDAVDYSSEELEGANFEMEIGACPPDGAEGNATVTVTYYLPALTPLVFSGPITITETGVMRCGL